MANMIITHVLHNIHIYSRIHRDKLEYIQKIHTRLVFKMSWAPKELVLCQKHSDGVTSKVQIILVRLEPKALTRSCHPSQHKDYANFEKPILNQDRVQILIAPNPTEINEAMIQKSVSEPHMTMVSLLRGRSNNSMTIKGVMLIRILRTVAEIIRNHGIQHVESKKSPYPQFSSIFINFLKSWTNPNDRSTPFTQNLTSPTEFYKPFPFPCHSPLARCQWQGLPCLHTGAVWIITKDFEQLLCTAFESNSRHPAISPSRLLRRKAGLNGTWERLRTFLTCDCWFYSSLSSLSFYTFVARSEKKKKEFTVTTQENNINWWNSTSNCSTRHMFLMFLFWIFSVQQNLGGPNWQLHWARVGSPHRGFGTPNSEPKNRHRSQHARRIDKVVFLFTTTKNN